MHVTSRSRLLWAIGSTLACLMLAVYPIAAQTVTTGTIAGVVKDAQGGVLPGAAVTVTSLETGLTRDVVTDQEGGYVVNLLPPGRYRIQAELIGLGKAEVPGVDVLLGNSTRADFNIAPQIAETVTVTATTPIVDTARPGTAASVTNEQIENLPLLGRDFRSLASLTPGITSAFGGRITANGARGIATDYNIDGATSNNDFFGENTGGTRAPFTFSQAAIREFQVVRSQYDPEFGRGVGAQLNAITKSGTNELHGEAFVFHRGDSWAASRPGELANGQLVVDSFRALDSTQPGFALGGPIVRDKAFFFVNFDAQRQERPIVITDLNLRREFQALPATLRQQFLSKIESVVGHPYVEELTYPQTFNQNTYLAKVDWNAGRQTRISVRDNYTNFENGNNQSLNHFSNQGTEHDKFNQLVGQATMVLADRLTNSVTVEHLRDERPIDPVSRGPEIQVSGITTGAQFFGQNDFLPNNTTETKTQVKDTLQYVIGRHTLKAGTDLLFGHIDNLFPRNANGVFLYSTPQAFVDGVPNSFRQGYGAGGGLTSWDQNTYAFFGADSIRVSPRMTVDVGVRYDWQTMPRPAANVFPQHPEFITQITEDKNNVAPRLGVAYDIFGDGHSVVRGGVGKFFGYLPSILLSNPLTQISGNFNQVTITCGTATTVKCPPYPSILTPDQFSQLARVATDIVTVSPTYQAQEAWRTSAQFEKQIGAGYSAAAGVIYSKMDRVQGSRNINAVPTGILLGNLPVYNIVSPNRRYPDMGVVRELCSCETASHKSFTI
ncbi:MAG: TonB-dependent receptor, partial [Acidobacteria bacterium]|nr:TonB-dependent receptor [Acidobacteriota bacterium]